MFAQRLQNKLKELSQQVANSVELADAETSAQRIEICKNCEFLISISNTCSKCGCFMAAKTKLKNVSCPIKKW